MFVKLLTLLLVILAILWMLRPSRPSIRREQPVPLSRMPRADDLVRCEGCGLWHAAGEKCNCEQASDRLVE